MEHLSKLILSRPPPALSDIANELVGKPGAGREGFAASHLTPAAGYLAGHFIGAKTPGASSQQTEGARRKRIVRRVGANHDPRQGAPAELDGPLTPTRPLLRERKFADSPPEEAVTSEPVSEAEIPC